VGWLSLGAAPFALLFFAYNRAVTGSMFTLAFSLVGPHDRFGFGPRSSLADPGEPGFYDFTPGEAWRTVLGFAGSLADWLPGGLLIGVFAYLGFRAVHGARVALWPRPIPARVRRVVGAANAWTYDLHDLLGPLYWFRSSPRGAVLGRAGIDAWRRDGLGPQRVPASSVVVLDRAPRRVSS
jgi:hypothetical protein